MTSAISLHLTPSPPCPHLEQIQTIKITLHSLLCLLFLYPPPQGLHLTAKIQDRGYGLESLRLKPRFETEPELYFILRSPKPRGLVSSSDRFNRGLV